MKVELENVLPRDIERRSFEIITEELGDTPLIPGTELIVKRCIHTGRACGQQQLQTETIGKQGRIVHLRIL